MIVKQSLYSLLTLCLGVLFFTACSPKDEDTVKAVKAKLAEYPKYEHVTVTHVIDGKPELKGYVETAEAKVECEEDIKKVKGVKSVDNDIHVGAPTAATVDVAKANAESDNDPILLGAKKALKDYPAVTSEVHDGEITISGDVTKDEEKAILERLNALKARKVNNNLNVIKDKDK